MFNAPFSFRGRIRRKEYALSVLVYVAVLLTTEFLTISNMHREDSGGGSLIIFFIGIPCVIFMLAQGVKRSHDVGNSGWFVFIPFYGFWLLFADSKEGENKYGPNPKGIGNRSEFDFESEYKTS